MRFVLRLVAIGAMIFALTEAGVTALSRVTRSTPTPVEGQAPTPPEPVWQKIKNICSDYHSPLSLFSFGAILFVLVRISAVQEQDDEVATPQAVPPKG